MRTLQNYKVEEETVEEQHSAGRYHPADVLIYKGMRMTLPSGTTDSISFFAEGDYIFALALNHRHGYAGLLTFDKEGKEAGTLFIQSEEEVEELIGKDWKERTDMTVCKRMAYLAQE